MTLKSLSRIYTYFTIQLREKKRSLSRLDLQINEMREKIVIYTSFSNHWLPNRSSENLTLSHKLKILEFELKSLQTEREMITQKCIEIENKISKILQLYKLEAYKFRFFQDVISD